MSCELPFQENILSPFHIINRFDFFSSQTIFKFDQVYRKTQ